MAFQLALIPFLLNFYLASPPKKPPQKPKKTYDLIYFASPRLKDSQLSFQKHSLFLPETIDKLCLYKKDKLYFLSYQAKTDFPSAKDISQQHAKILHDYKLIPNTSKKYHPYITNHQKQECLNHQDSFQEDFPKNNLESLVKKHINYLRHTNQLNSTDEISIVLYDIKKQKKLIALNQDEPMIAASIIKPFIMLAYYTQLRYKKIKKNSLDETKIKQMIQYSDNPATDYIIKRLGGPKKVRKILKKRYPFFKQTKIVESIINGLNNGHIYKNYTSTHDLNRFFYQLQSKKFPYSDKMLQHLRQPNHTRLFKDCHIKSLNKTGTVYPAINDGGIYIFNSKHKEEPFILSIMLQDPTKIKLKNRKQPYSLRVDKYETLLDKISRLIYQHLHYYYRPSLTCRQNTS